MSRLLPLNAAKRTTLIVALLGVLGIATGLALAATAPPAPTINSAPPLLLGSGSATLSFSDAQPGVTFLCSLDGAPYEACSSPRTYTGLRPILHTFAVKAKDSAGNTSAPASSSWTVTLTGPPVSIVFPANGGDYNSSAWSAGCASGAGVCGSASALTGITAVNVSAQQISTGMYWNGTAYASRAQIYSAATLTKVSGGANWFSRLPLPPDGHYLVHVRATDGLGLQTSDDSPWATQFTIDTVVPPAPSVTGSPDDGSDHPGGTDPTSSQTEQLALSDTETGVSYQCQLDTASWAACASPATYTALSYQTHTFGVRAVDAAGNVSPATTFTWTVAQRINENFTVSSSPVGALYPGAPAQPLVLTINNLNTVPIYLTGLTATLSVDGAHSACNTSFSGPSPNFAITPAPIITSPVKLLPGATTFTGPNALAALSMLDTSSDQRPCMGAALTITYSGSAHS